jgi:hypothetical protein
VVYAVPPSTYPAAQPSSKRTGWLPPSLESRLANVLCWVRQLQRLCPIGALSQELVRFDTQLLLNRRGFSVGKPKATSVVESFRSGDLVRVVVPTPPKTAGVHVGAIGGRQASAM